MIPGKKILLGRSDATACQKILKQEAKIAIFAAESLFPYMHTTSTSVQAPLFTTHFALLCTSGFLFFGSFNMIVPELPAYLSSLGGEDYKGLIIALFTVTAGLSRPFSGKLADRIGRIPVMVFGVLTSCLSSLLYPVVGTVSAFFLLRFFHGFSTGFTPTGASAYLADIVPENRRGEAIGIMGFCTSTGMAIGPALGGYIAAEYSLEWMFHLSAFSALLSILILVGMKETLQNRERFHPSMLRLKKDEILERNILVPGFVMALCVYSFGCVLTVIPDYSDYLGLSNRGLFFTCFTSTSLLVRIVAGKISDRYGRIIVLKVSILTLAISMAAIGFSQSIWMLFASAAVFGLAVGTNSPTIFAWSVDLSAPERRGRALATAYIALEVGIGCGSLFSSWIFANDPARFPITFLTASALATVALVFIFWLDHRQKT